MDDVNEDRNSEDYEGEFKENMVDNDKGNGKIGEYEKGDNDKIYEVCNDNDYSGDNGNEKDDDDDDRDYDDYDGNNDKDEVENGDDDDYGDKDGRVEDEDVDDD